MEIGGRQIRTSLSPPAFLAPDPACTRRKVPSRGMSRKQHLFQLRALKAVPRGFADMSWSPCAEFGNGGAIPGRRQPCWPHSPSIAAPRLSADQGSVDVRRLNVPLSISPRTARCSMPAVRRLSPAQLGGLGLHAPRFVEPGTGAEPPNQKKKPLVAGKNTTRGSSLPRCRTGVRSRCHADGY